MYMHLHMDTNGAKLKSPVVHDFNLYLHDLYQNV